MNRQQLEHIIRAAVGIADTRDIVIVGSQAILGTYPNAPADLTMSMEADLFPKENPRDAILIDGAIGELSIFPSDLRLLCPWRGRNDCGAARGLAGAARTDSE